MKEEIKEIDIIEGKVSESGFAGLRDSQDFSIIWIKRIYWIAGLSR